MKRLALAAIILLYALTVPAGLTAAQSNSTQNAMANNSTVQDFRESLDEKNQKIADLETQVVQKNSRIQRLEFQLEESNTRNGFSQREVESLRELGAWNSDTNQTAFMMWVDSESGGLYVFVGPGNGGHSFNGMNAWTRVLGGDITLAGNITFTLPYAPEGINKDQNIENGLNSNAAAELQQLIESFNQPETRQAWERYNNEKRQKAESEDLQSSILSHLAVLGIGVFLMLVESRRHIFWGRREKKKEQKRDAAIYDSTAKQTSKLDRLKEFWR